MQTKPWPFPLLRALGTWPQGLSFPVVSLAVSLALLTGCAGGRPSVPPGDASPTANEALTLSPSQATVMPGAALSLQAWFQGLEDRRLTWHVNNLEGGSPQVGTLVVTGETARYTAPPASGTFTLSARSVADPRIQATVKLEVCLSRIAPPKSTVVFNVREAPFGAHGDGRADDTSALQAAMDAAANTGGTVWIPKGTYLVDAAKNHSGGIYGLRLRSGMTLRMDPEARLKAIPNDKGIYAILMAADVQDVQIQGGILEGDRATHLGTDGEWGMGLFIRRAQRLVAEDLIALECWGDGFYVDLSSDIVLHRVTADHNRRQGLTIDSVGKMDVINSLFKNTQGTLPEVGINLEPDRGRTITGPVLISGCQCLGNAGRGLMMTVPATLVGSANVSGVTVSGCTLADNGFLSLYKSPMPGLLCNQAQHVKLEGNLIQGNAGDGIRLTGTTTRDVHVLRNTVKGNGMNGILLADLTASVVRQNRVTGNLQQAIKNMDTTGNTISDNLLQ